MTLFLSCQENYLVQMYSNLEWETDLAEELSMGKRQVLGEKEGEWQSDKIGNVFSLQHKFKLIVNCRFNLIITLQYNGSLHTDDCLFWFLPVSIKFSASEEKDHFLTEVDCVIGSSSNLDARGYLLVKTLVTLDHQMNKQNFANNLLDSAKYFCLKFQT